MAYKTLYRKYRPVKFEDVCGQEFIVQTLKNAMLSEKISHAYLFCGTRGTGKTTIAKIFAKNVNCLNIKNGIPCEECEICLKENTDEIQDIIEIDAASNNGVDEIRELKNKIKLVPVMCKYKVYIIDEVHMLSTGAFNALLKTLEEPPKHVIFILATTEPQKLPVTIISRCQRFDFKKISISDIEKRLIFISEKEKINITNESITEIAKMSDGAMRDAIGLLDQVSSYSNKEISIDDIYQISGKVSYETIYKIINLYIANDINNILDIVEEIYIEGKDFVSISEDLLMFFRDVFINKKAPIYFNNKDISIKEYIIDISNKLTLSQIELIISKLEQLTREIRNSNFPRILFEMFLLKNCYNEQEKFVEQEEVKKVVEESQPYLKNEKEQNTKLKSNVKETPQEIPKIDIIQNEYTNETQLNFDEQKSNYKKAMINNTIALATNKSKKELETIFLNLNKYLINKKYKVVATILKDAVIAAVSDDHILLTYKYVSMVDDNDKELVKVMELIKEMTGNNYKVVAITTDEWKEKRPYYIELKKEKGTIPLLEEVEVKIDNTLPNEEEILADEAINIFGSELIEMEG